ncbi:MULTISPECIES: ABC transporter ATP-binding protein [unclassified Microcella]|uniref:ABC transporter ATP-binding protein n=1 Tax=unclassified Microcella TaxID=2630066 RepID=UPI0006FD377E|nr:MULTISPECIES: ATP-binding cassette domain-containing protein [unclassified Microcella]KQV25843.1 ABC transporter ATP-binding protein [Yonghaparkia sp. Root332]KRF33348.1 ABC transporter ATP-binding protein [Yonghaparkia sp. Soil809]
MLEIRGATKRFGDRTVLDDVTFGVGAGRLTGFVGGNGAGKTTTMRILLGVLDADAGEVLVDGRPITADDRRGFGYMPEERGLYPKMRVHEQLVYLARLRGMRNADASDAADDLIDRLELSERRDEPIEKLSLGNQQRAQIAAALVHDPSVLVLDEPFSGLDPMAVETVLGVLAERAARGVPVLFSSHQLDLVERLCDDVVVISEGRIRAAGTRDELRSRGAGRQWELQVGDDAGWVRSLPEVAVIEFDGDYVLFEADPAAAQSVLRLASERGAVERFAPRRPTLTEIFREVVQ